MDKYSSAAFLLDLKLSHFAKCLHAESRQHKRKQREKKVWESWIMGTLLSHFVQSCLISQSLFVLQLFELDLSLQGLSLATLT